MRAAPIKLVCKAFIYICYVNIGRGGVENRTSSNIFRKNLIYSPLEDKSNMYLQKNLCIPRSSKYGQGEVQQDAAGNRVEEEEKNWFAKLSHKFSFPFVGLVLVYSTAQACLTDGPKEWRGIGSVQWRGGGGGSDSVYNKNNDHKILL